MWGRSSARLFAYSFNVPRDPTIARWSSVLLGAIVMVFSLLAYFCSMVVGFVAIMAILFGLSDSQMRTTPPSHFPDPAVSIAATTPAPPRANLAEQDKAAEQDKPEQAQKPAREDVNKIARAKMARERRREMMQARLRQQREERNDALALGYANQPFNAPTYTPFGQRTEY